MHALQDECRDRVTGEELKMQIELQHALEHESALCKQSAQSLEASLDQRVHESLHHSAERKQRFVTEAQREIAFLKNQIQQQTQSMVQMDEEVKQFKDELLQSLNAL